MKRIRVSLLGLGIVAMAAGLAQAESKVELTGVHLCCGSCVKGVAGAIKTVEGAKGACDQKAGKVTITAADDATVKKAVEAVAEAGYHGTPDKAEFAAADDSGAPKGKVSKLTVTGIHNCCGSCNKAVKKAVAAVEGVKGDTAKSKEDSFEVTGDFSAQELVKSLNAAGFHVHVK